MVTHCSLDIILLSLMNHHEVQQAYSCSSKSHSSPQAHTVSATLNLLDANLLTLGQEESDISETAQKTVA